MISFFRKIRQNLLNEGKTVQYIKYAIGEISLVVVGILIALQINNWNENNQKIEREKELIGSLYVEVMNNIDFTIDYQKQNQRRIAVVLELLNLNAEELELSSDEQLMEKLHISATTFNYTPSINKLNRLLSREDSTSKQSKKIISLLYQYSNSIKNIEVQDKAVLDTFMDKQLPLFNKNISVKNIMNQLWPERISMSKNTVDLKVFIKTLEFENIYGDIYATSMATSIYLDSNIKLMRKIVQQIEESYPTVIYSEPSSK